MGIITYEKLEQKHFCRKGLIDLVCQIVSYSLRKKMFQQTLGFSKLETTW